MMTGKLFTTAAAAAIFASSTAFAPGAFAQSATQPSDNNPPAATAPAMTPDATKPATPAPAPDTKAEATTPAPAPASTTSTAQMGTYITEQAPDQVSANTYIGQSVYNASNESVGKVTDLDIVNRDRVGTARHRPLF